MADVVLRDVVKRFGKVEVVHGVNLDFHDNEFIVLVGPSGCGKSTILRMIAGLEKITRGDILINGQIVNDVAPKDRGIAMVFQNYALYPHMNVFNNMSFGLKLSKTPKDEIIRRVHETADILELGELLHRRPHELSGGQRQRVAMGRAMVRNPAIFLFDEPLSNLDAKLRTQMRTEIKLLHQRVQVTTIYVTHDQVEAMTLADRIVVMNNGYVEQVGGPIDLFETRQTRSWQDSSAARHESRAGEDHQAGQGYLPGFQRGSQAADPEKEPSAVREGMDVIMGLRTEDFSIDNGANGFPEEWKVIGTVEVVEPLGGETNMHMIMQGVRFTARSEERRVITVGEELRLALNLKHLHIFDAKTTRSIY
jgi:multiple sugar transport system ATP-binding protein